MWKRPAISVYPTIYSRCEGKLETNGKKRQYWIQDLTEEYYETVLNNLDGFLQGEPLSKYSKLYECQESVKQFREAWKTILIEKASLVCLTKNERGEIEVAGFNMTGLAIRGKDNLVKILKSEKAKMVYDACLFVSKKVDIFALAESDAILTALGLYVLPKYRGEGLGEEILKARRGLCNNLNLKGSSTVFTSVISQKQAEKAGFKVVVSVPYEEMEKVDPSLRFPGISDFTKNVTYMFVKYY